MALKGRGKDHPDGPVPKGKGSARLKRINGIKGRLENGKYRIEPKKVADKMVEDAIREIRSRGR